MAYFCSFRVSEYDAVSPPYLAVFFREFLVGADDVVEVRVHELSGDVDVVEGLRDRRRDHISEAYNVLVVEVPEELDLPERALGVHVVVEGVCDLLDCHHLPGLEVHHRAAPTQPQVEFQDQID